MNSPGPTTRLSTVGFLAGVVLLLVAGLFATDAFLSPTSTATTPGSTGSSSQTSALPSTTSTFSTTQSASNPSSASLSYFSAAPGTSQIVLPVDVGNNESLNFEPSQIKVVVGVNNTIVWNDLDYVQHTVQSVKLPAGAKPWNSGILNEGQTFTVVLTVPGMYEYDCSIHPDWMVGTIQVLA